jgi:malate synthase
MYTQVKLADTGNTVTRDLAHQLLDEETERLRGEVNDDECFERFYAPAAKLIADLTLGEGEFVEFLTQPAYELVS